jgi:hypothetical protein
MVPVGDSLHATDGVIKVESIESSEKTAFYNLHAADCRNFVVRSDGLTVHDFSLCSRSQSHLTARLILN